jgi:hypothetical protein
MTVSTVTPQPMPLFPQASLTSRQDLKDDDKAQKGGSAGGGHQAGNPKSPTDPSGAAIGPDIDPSPCIDPGRR